jgi:histidyl-tRNA synthetase
MRGFSYYTGNVFEIWSNEKKAALAGGGRYDDKVGKYVGRKIPAVGISFGTLIDYEGINVIEEKYLVVSLNRDEASISLAQKLRNKNKIVSLFYGKPSKALEYANSYNFNKVIFIGEREIKSKKFKVKDMKSGKESLLKI